MTNILYTIIIYPITQIKEIPLTFDENNWTKPEKMP